MSAASSRELSVVDRLQFRGAVVSDHGLRTALGLIAAATAGPYVLRGTWRHERRDLGFYADLAERADAEAVFARPAEIDVDVTPGRPAGLPDARVDILRFTSPFETLNPAIAKRYARHVNNEVARAQHWRHLGGARPTLMVIHGFGASPAWFNARFFGLRELFAEGYDILLYTLPFHGSRRGDRAVVNGAEIFAHGLAHLSEAVLQGVHDARVLLRYLNREGVRRIGVTGLSLGGYHAALLAAVEPGLHMVVPNAAVTSLHEVVRGWFPATLTVGATRRLAGLRDEDVAAALAVHSPLTYRPVVPRRRLMIVAGHGDRLAEPEHSSRLWEHWSRPEIHWFPGSHVLHFGRGAYREAMRGRMGSPQRP